MNQVILIGRLTADPELRFAASTGRAVTNFRLAVDRPFSKEKKTDFFRIVVWGKQAEAVAKYLKKGSQCAVNGSIQIEQYTDRDGNNRYSTDIVANQVEFLGSPGRSQDSYEEESSFGGSQEMDSDFPVVDDEDIPF
ncbi:MAG: single-stranded DNA-binding protein [Tissierellia bacterium]|nr:single-stranded DNA-binding protein [Tissierellia bacterium]